jgi:hypothetical protein
MTWLRRGLAVLIPIVLVACASSSPSVTPEAQGAPASLPLGLPSVAPAQSAPTTLSVVSPSATPGALVAPARLPTGWVYLSWADPAMEIALPSDWSTGGLDPNAPFTSEPGASLDPAQRKYADFVDKMAAMGVWRLAAYGMVAAPSGAVDGGSISVLVESGDASLDAFADRSIQVDRSLVGESTPVDRAKVALLSGDAVRVRFAGKVGAWPKFSEVDYLLRLADGRSMTIAISGSDAADDPSMVAAFANQVIATLKPTPELAGLPEGWITYNAPDGSFALGFPRKPEESSQSDAQGIVYGLSVDQVYTMFKFAYIDYPPGLLEKVGVKTLADQMVAGVAPSPAAVTSTKDISLDGHPGREFMAEGGQDVVVGRLYVVGGRLYELYTLTYPDHYSDEAAKVHAFLESLQLASP